VSVGLLCSAILGGLTGPPGAEGAKRLGPPSDFMRHQANKSAILVAREPAGEGRFDFSLEQALQGETPDEITLRVSPQGLDMLETGVSYLVGYSDLWQPRNRRSDAYQIDPNGPRVLQVPVVGPALFEASTAMRALVAPAAASEDGTVERARLDAIVAQVQRPDRQSRLFVLAELALRPELHELAGESDLTALRETLASGDLDPATLELFLRATAPMADRWGGEWLAAACRDAIVEHGANLDLGSAVPSMLVVALRTLGKTGRVDDAPLAGRHVASNNPGVGKAAFGAMASLDPALAAERAPALLADEAVHGDTKGVIAEFQSARSSARDR
jgi:hypothetical protein